MLLVFCLCLFSLDRAFYLAVYFNVLFIIRLHKTIMADLVATTTTNDNDDWEVAVDTGEFDKRHEQQEKARAANQVRCLQLYEV